MTETAVIMIASQWWLQTEQAELIGPFPSNAVAWRHHDRRTGDPISRSEAVTEWWWSRP
jgi:hypothetical protein